jgi:ABC-2 type transport system ATP-binding protein
VKASRPVIITENLTKYYHRTPGIIDLNLEVGEGEVFGYLGPNGAGKTTTIRLLLNFIMPSSGKASVLSRDIVRDSVVVRKHTGYLPGSLNLYSDLKGEDFLKYAAHLRGGVDWSYVKQLAERLQCDLSVRISSLSHGNRQKIGLIQAFMHRPSLFILDEPTTGLDPLVQQEFYRLVQEAKANGQTIFMSSHVLPEVERICDRVGIVREGRLAAVEGIDALKSCALRHIEIRFARPVPPEKFNHIEGIKDFSLQDTVLRCTVIGELDAIVKAAAEFPVINIISHEPSLEEIFLTYYGKGEKIVS